MPSSPVHGDHPPERFAEAIRAGDRASLARAITLVESQKEEDRQYAYEVLRFLMPATGDSQRIAISGPPGVGKSTLIEAFGLRLIDAGHRVAVLAIDPSSSLSGGSILGDKSRMSELARSEAAFIRPSPTDLALGGVTRRTREGMFLCEAAGFDRILVETVGVGQSEIQVAGMADSFIVLVQPGSGDELQGIKKGILELADLLVVNKTDGDTLAMAREAAAEHSAALRYLGRAPGAWTPRVINASAREGEGLPELEALVNEHRAHVVRSGELASRREADLENWLCQLTEEAIVRRHKGREQVQARVEKVIAEVASGAANAYSAAVDLASNDES